MKPRENRIGWGIFESVTPIKESDKHLLHLVNRFEVVYVEITPLGIYGVDDGEEYGAMVGNRLFQTQLEANKILGKIYKEQLTIMDSMKSDIKDFIDKNPDLIV